MSIYSTNRSGSVAFSSIQANESYKSNDLGRILYESQINDMRIFEAVLASDFREIKGLQEGTLLRSEIQSLNEATAKSVLETLKKELVKFWAKIKGALTDAARKIAAYILRSGKAYAKDCEEFFKKHKDVTAEVTTDLPTFFATDSKKGIDIPSANEMNDEIKKQHRSDEKLSKADIISSALANTLTPAMDKNDCNPSSYREEVRKRSIDKDKKFSTSDKALINTMLDCISNSSKSISRIKKFQSEAEQGLSALKKEMERSLKDDGDVAIQNITTLCSAYKTVLTTTASASVDAINLSVKTSRKALGKLMSAMRGGKEVSTESAIIAGDEFDNAMEDYSVDNLDSDTAEAVEEAIASAE